ncbi:MAG: hypothetical protein ACLFXM_14105 [Acidimicrobiia bacterium]
MNEGARRTIGWVVVAVGAVVALVGGLADQMGLGGDGPDKFGPRQVVAVAIGVVLVAVGVAVALWRSTGEEGSSTGGDERSTGDEERPTGEAQTESGLAEAEPPS